MDSVAHKPLVGAGMTQWKVGWSLLGIFGNLGLLIGGIFFLQEATWMGVLWVGSFLFVSIAPMLIWRRRHTLDPYLGMQLIFAASALAWTAALGTAILVRPDLLIKYSGDPQSTWQTWLMQRLTENPALGLLGLLVFPAFQLFYHQLEMRSRNWKSKSEAA